jgi:hypothetical protein
MGYRAKRDHAAQYRRRVERALARGLSRSQGRGHPRAGEKSIQSKAKPADKRLEKALKSLRASNNQAKAARDAGVSPERFRRFLRENNLAHREGRSWRITDERPRQVLVTSNGDKRWIEVLGFEPASLVGRHNEAIKQFRQTNDISLLEPFVGVSVTDAAGRKHLLETNPNTLHRLTAAGTETFENVYRLVS